MEDNRKKTIAAEIGLLFVALFWGGGFVAGKFALETVTPLVITAYRYGGASLIMLLVCGKNLKHVNKKVIVGGSIIGVLMFIGNTLQTIGLQYTTPGKQSFIISMYTVLVPLMSWVLLKQKPSKRILAAALVALIGISLLTLTEDLSVGLGDGLTFVFAITFSLQVIIIGLFMKDVNPMAFTFVQMAVAAILSVATALIFEAPIWISQMSTASIMGIVYLVVFNSVLAFLLQNISQKYAAPNHVAIILASETVFGTFFAITMAGEIFTNRMIAGCVLMFLAIAIAEMPSPKAKILPKAE